MHLHLLQHVPFEGPGRIADWAAERGITLRPVRLSAGETLPALSEVEGVVVMGGPMNLHQHRDFPWLVEEKRFLKEALAAGRKTFGVCLGAQLIANALGAEVYQNPEKEIGWFGVEFTPEARARFSGLAGLPESLPVLHWHGDTFELPRGATRLAESRWCANQGFTWGETALALQFHLEAGAAECRAWIEHGAGEIAGAVGSDGTIHGAKEIEAGAVAHAARANAVLYGMLDRFFCEGRAGERR